MACSRSATHSTGKVIAMNMDRVDFEKEDGSCKAKLGEFNQKAYVSAFSPAQPT